MKKINYHQAPIKTKIRRIFQPNNGKSNYQSIKKKSILGKNNATFKETTIMHRAKNLIVNY